MKHKHNIIKITKLAWLLVCFLIGVSCFHKGPFTGGSVADLMEMMTIVTFPIGYLAIYLIRAMLWFFPATGSDEMVRSYNIAIALWVLMTVLGYLQWFYLLPKFLGKIRPLQK